MGLRPVCRVLLAALVLLPVLAGPALAATQGGSRSRVAGPSRAEGVPADPPGSLPGAPAATSGDVALDLTTLTPAVANAGQTVTISGTIRNPGSSTLHKPVIRVVANRSTLSRDEVLAWAKATGPALGTQIGTTTLPTDLLPGVTAPFQIKIRHLADQGSAMYGALPISIESGTSSLRTFAGYQVIKQYQPMSIAWAVPLTLPPDADLFGPDGANRELAWAQAVGPQSRLGRILDATTDARVTWAVDPTLTPSLLPGAVDTSPATTQEHLLRAALEGRIRDGASRHTPWVLPDTDADVAALVGASDSPSLVAALVSRATPVAQALGGRADVAWPSDPRTTSSTEGALSRLFGRTGLAGEVTSASQRAVGPSGETPAAAQRSTSGVPLLAYDAGLSALLARTTAGDEGVLSTQQFVAESAALLNELPGTQGRSVFVAAPRTFDPDPTAARAFFAAAASIPWLTTTTTDAELSAARAAAPTQGAPVTLSAEPSTAAPPVLTSARVNGLEQTLDTVRGVAQVREDGATFARTWARATEQLASTRWRASPVGWNLVNGKIQAATRQTTTAVKVLAGTINFLADSGRLQITVTNGLDVPVRNIKVTVEASNPRLRIDSQPPILRIGAGSRATVSVGVTALAAGIVPLRTTLTTPDGTVIGQGADVEVRVTPTGNWVYWALGGLAGVVLLLGIIRSFTRRPAARPAADLPERAQT
jgi:hypothetical protein